MNAKTATCAGRWWTLWRNNLNQRFQAQFEGSSSTLNDFSSKMRESIGQETTYHHTFSPLTRIKQWFGSHFRGVFWKHLSFKKISSHLPLNNSHTHVSHDSQIISQSRPTEWKGRKTMGQTHRGSSKLHRKCRYRPNHEPQRGKRAEIIGWCQYRWNLRLTSTACIIRSITKTASEVQLLLSPAREIISTRKLGDNLPSSGFAMRRETRWSSSGRDWIIFKVNRKHQWYVNTYY